MLGLYRTATDAVAPLVRLYLDHRLRRGKEDGGRLGERFGVASQPRPDGALVWVHAASVGESLSMLPLIERLRRDHPGITVLMTTGTVTSARLMASRLPDGALHQYVPLDRRPWVRRFIDHWRPDAVLWVESELWPNALAEIKARGVPLALVNARMSPRSFRGWRRFPRAARTLLGHFDLCLAQSEDDAAHLTALGAKRVLCRGNLKFAAAPLPADEMELARLSRAVGRRPVWLAASTHPGEETVVAEAHAALRRRHPDILTIVAPRHPARGAEIAAELGRTGRPVARRDASEPAARETEFYVADTMGELGIFFRVARVVFVGGSLVPHGGQNPLEPAKLGCALVFGPHMFNFRAIVEELAAARAADTVRDAIGLSDVVGGLLADPASLRARGAAANAIAAGKGGIVDDVLAELAPILPSDAATSEDAAAPRMGIRGKHARA
jgi:3-deoxy-D-manno-octulosonic-acid transferase